MATMYPTWNRFLKMWKTIIYPIIKQNVNVAGWDRPSNDEEYVVDTKDVVNKAKIESIIYQIQDALIDRGYNVDSWAGDKYADSDLTINGKNRYDPSIDISVYSYEDDDDTILYGWDDCRWADWNAPQDEFGFKPEYSKWLKEHDIVDNYENIRKAPKEVKKSYCDWVRSKDYNHIWISIQYVE